MKYFEEAKYIWKNLVPKEGQANNVQGELLRQLEKLRYEAQNNGNINWDSNFEYFCDFITDTLKESKVLSKTKMEEVTQALNKIKSIGIRAYNFNTGKISEDELEKKYNFELAYCEDDLYDIVVDAIAVFYLKYKESIPYSKNTKIYR